MASITTRSTAGSGATVKNLPLSNSEIDSNFLNLNSFKVETTDAVSINTANAVVRRDGSGGFLSGSIGITGTLDVSSTSSFTSNATFSSDVAVNGGDLTTTAITFNLLNANATTVNAFGAATAINFGFASTTTSSTTNIATNALVGGFTKTINIGTGGTTASTTTINIGSSTNGSTTINGGLGVGTTSSKTNGEIRAAGDISSNYSDERLKENIQVIENALEKVCSLRGVTYTANQLAESFGYTSKESQVGVLAAEVEKVLPEVVKPAPFDIMLFENTEISRSGENYKTVQYEKLVPLLIEAIKELNKEIQELKGVK